MVRCLRRRSRPGDCFLARLNIPQTFAVSLENSSCPEEVSMRVVTGRRGLRFSFVLGLSSLILSLVLLGNSASAQQRFIRGQNVQPAFEGWEQNADGSYTMVFGYLNRNWEEEPHVPIGPDNTFSPGPADRGQPTHFYPRRQMYVFKVRVPADWGDKELVWTVTYAGRTDTAVGWLAGFYEIDTSVLRAQRSGSSGRASTEDELRAQPPSITVDGPDAVTTSVAEPVTLAVTVSDDGLPGPAPSRSGRPPRTISERPRETPDGAPAQDMVSIFAATETGLAVTWLHYQGPGTVTFDPMHVPLDKAGGRAETTVHFDQPGTHVIRGVANDQVFTVPVNVTVTVAPGTTEQP